MRFSGIRLLVLTASAGLLVACSSDGTFRDRANDYRQAKLSAPLSLPEGVEAIGIRDSYRVPGIESHVVLPGKFVTPRPDPLAKNVGQSEVRIQRMGDERWILVDGAPGQVWPRLRIFVDKARLKVSHVQANAGIIDTDWRDLSEGVKERFRLQVDQGVQRATSEIRVLQMQDEGSMLWPAASTDPEREAHLVKVLAQFLADTEAAGSISRLAQQGKTGGKIFIEGEADKRHLRLALTSDRAWATLGLGLEKAGFEITDSLAETRRYLLIYKDPSIEEPGWFKRLFGAEAPEPEKYVADMSVLGDASVAIYLNFQDGQKLADTRREELLKRLMGYLY